MKITPLEIRQKAFERTMRGYDKDEVTAFLVTLSQEWERLLDETKELRIKYESSEREVSKLREVESSLYKTLKTAEDTGANMIDQATKTAELHMREMQFKAEAILNEAKSKAKDTLDQAEMSSKDLVVEMEERLKDLVEDYKKLEQQRDILVADLKRISNETMERADRVKKNNDDFNPDQYLSRARKELKKIIYPNSEPTQPPVPAPVKIEAPVEESKPQPIIEVPKPIEAPVPTTTRSFFDDIS
jgi:cell division initiation protein